MANEGLEARKALLERVSGEAVATAWLEATESGNAAVDTVMVLADPADELTQQFMERKEGLELRPDGFLLTPVPSLVASMLCQGNANESMAQQVRTPPQADEGRLAFWCMLIANAGVTLVPVQVESS